MDDNQRTKKEQGHSHYKCGWGTRFRIHIIQIKFWLNSRFWLVVHILLFLEVLNQILDVQWVCCWLRHWELIFYFLSHLFWLLLPSLELRNRFALELAFALTDHIDAREISHVFRLLVVRLWPIWPGSLHRHGIRYFAILPHLIQSSQKSFVHLRKY